MRVNFRCARVLMTKDFAHHVKAMAARYGDGGEAVAKVMEPHVFEVRGVTHPLPNFLQTNQVPPLARRRKHVRLIRETRQALEQIERRSTNRDDLCPCLAVRKPKQSALLIDVAPLQ